MAHPCVLTIDTWPADKSTAGDWEGLRASDSRQGMLPRPSTVGAWPAILTRKCQTAEQQIGKWPMMRCNSWLLADAAATGRAADSTASNLVRATQARAWRCMRLAGGNKDNVQYAVSGQQPLLW